MLSPSRSATRALRRATLVSLVLGCSGEAAIPQALPKDERLPPPTPVLVERMSGLEDFVAMSPDQRKVFMIRWSTEREHYFTGTLRVWEVDTGRVVEVAQHARDRVVTEKKIWPWIAFDSRSQRALISSECSFLVAGMACDMAVVDLNTYAVTPTLESITGATWRAAPELGHVVGLVSSHIDAGVLMEWDARSGQATQIAADVPAASLAMSPAGDSMVFAIQGQESYAQHLEDGRVVRLEDGMLMQPVYRQDGRLVAYGTEHGLVVYDLATDTRRTLSANPAARPLAFAGESGKLVFYVYRPETNLQPCGWEGASLFPIFVADPVTGAITDIDSDAAFGGDNFPIYPALSPNGRWLAYEVPAIPPARPEPEIRAFDLRAGARRVVFRGHFGKSHSNSFDFTFDSRKLLYHAEVQGYELPVGHQYDFETEEDVVLGNFASYYLSPAGKRSLSSEVREPLRVDNPWGKWLENDVTLIVDYERETIDEIQGECPGIGFGGRSFSPDENVLGYESTTCGSQGNFLSNLYYYDSLRGAATEAFDSTTLSRDDGTPMLAMDDRVAYILAAPDRSGLYYVPVTR